jgi:SAM-dependent methyltransferase
MLTFDRLTDFAKLRRVEPYRKGFGAHRGQCIDRYYIEAFLNSHMQDIRGHVLEVQSDQYMSQFGGGRISKAEILDINESNPKRTITADLSNCPGVPSDAFDCVICTQTLLVIYDVRGAIHELHRMVKPGGVVLVTVPGIAQVCERSMIGEGEDYWRFTSSSTRRLFAESFGESNLEVVAYGNVLAAVAFLHGLVVPELTAEELEYNDPDYQVIVGVRARKAG